MDYRLLLCTVILFSLLPFTRASTSANNASPSVDLQTSSGYTLSDPRELTANYTYIVDASDTTTFQLSMHVIQPFAYARIADTMIVTAATKPFTNQTTIDDLGNTVLTITFQSQGSSSLGQFYVTVLQHFTAYAISYSVDPAKVGSYDTSSNLYKLYTRSVQYIESDNPAIVAKAKEIAGRETNPYLVAEKIQAFVHAHMTYNLTAVTPLNPATEGALFALNSGKGICRHYAALFTALARAAGIPTADIWGSRPTEQGSVVDRGDQKHNWVQFFIPNYGWITADPTLNEFPQLDHNHIPVMSVNYVYRRAWGSGNWQSAFSGEEPVITIQVPEFYGTATFVWLLVIATIVIVIVTISLFVRIRRRRS